MAHRSILSARQRAALFDLPTDEASLLQHYTLDDDDIERIRTRRRRGRTEWPRLPTSHLLDGLTFC
jgi:hypothetical protein